MQQRHTKKRQDIQCLRTLAIAGVIGFHLSPNLFPSGYLGVDVFFVISGYLMTSILNYSKTQSFTGASLYRFYTRRIKRIFPPYLLMILMTVIICRCNMIAEDWILFRIDAFWALGFGSNVQSLVEKHDYFDTTQKYKFLLHAWSLGVEIQFYVVAPFLLFAIAVWKKPLICSYLVIVLSWALQSFYSNEIYSFGFVGCRLWQFLFGTIAFYHVKTIDKHELLPQSECEDGLPRKQPSFSISNFMFTVIVISLITVVCLPYLNPSEHNLVVLTRTMATTWTSGVIVLASTGANLMFKVPQSITNGLAFIGDMSYSIYLIHWPLIIVAKYLLIFDQIYTLYFIIAIFAISYLQYNFVELPLTKQSSKVIYFFISMVYGLTLLLLLIKFGLFEKTQEDVIKQNENIFKTCEADLNQLRNNCTMHPDIKWNRNDMPIDTYLCSYEGKGNLTILLTGNSYVMRSYHTFIDTARHLYKHLYVATQSMCTVFISQNEPSWRCNHVSNILPQIVERLTPDVMIVNQRLSVSNVMNAPLPSLDAAKNDSLVSVMADYWQLYSNFTKQIIVIEPSPTWYNTGRESFIKLLKLNQSFDSWHIPIKTYDDEVNPGWWRTLASIKDCSKCTAIPIRQHFCHESSGLCDMYDAKTKESLFCDEGHLSFVGVYRYIQDVISAFKF